MKLFVCFAITIYGAFSLGAQAPHNASERSTAYIPEQLLSSRVLPFFSAVSSDPVVVDIFVTDSILSGLARERWIQVDAKMRSCGSDVHCLVTSLKFNDDEINLVDQRLRSLYEEKPPLRSFVHSRLVPHEEYSMLEDNNDAQLLGDAWKHSALFINRIIATYADGKAPHYDQIDSMAYAPQSPEFVTLLRAILEGLRLPSSDQGKVAEDLAETSKLFYESSFRFAVRLLAANGRDEAARLWPLSIGENSAAIKSLPRVSWTRYRYSSIVIPGAGPDIYEQALSPVAIERLRLGVAAYRRGMAPFILVSGGYVHPPRTTYCEALEMKRFLIQLYGIPEKAILVDPYARHTTTNLRNASRIVFDYGLRADRPMLVVSDSSQTDAMAGVAFVERNRQELGYMPVQIGRRLSPNELEATPLRASRYIGDEDPLDP